MTSFTTIKLLSLAALLSVSLVSNARADQELDPVLAEVIDANSLEENFINGPSGPPPKTKSGKATPPPFGVVETPQQAKQREAEEKRKLASVLEKIRKQKSAKRSKASKSAARKSAAKSKRPTANRKPASHSKASATKKGRSNRRLAQGSR